MRTQEEMTERYKEKAKEMFDFEHEVILPYLDFEHGKEFFDSEKCFDAESLKKFGGGLLLIREVIIKEITDYMPFAVDKVCDHRGLFTSRSISKMCGWLWLLEDDELLVFAECDDNYTNYGAPVLKAIIDKYGIKIEEAKDKGFLNMAQGKMCYEGCMEGCG